MNRNHIDLDNQRNEPRVQLTKAVNAAMNLGNEQDDFTVRLVQSVVEGLIYVGDSVRWAAAHIVQKG